MRESQSKRFWDFTYVLEIAAGVCTVLDAPVVPNQVYNLNRGVQVTSDELIDTFTQVYASVRFVGPVTEQAVFAQSANRRGVMDSSRIREDLGFSCQYNLVSGLSAYINWCEEFGFTT